MPFQYASHQAKLLSHNELSHLQRHGIVNALGSAPAVSRARPNLEPTEMTKVTAINRKKRFLVLALLASLTLGPNLLGGAIFATVQAKGKGSDPQKAQPSKVPSDLTDLPSKKSRSLRSEATLLG